MRVLIVVPGTRGDVDPITGLAGRLQGAGHRVVLATHRAFADLVATAKLDLHVLSDDPPDVFSIESGSVSETQRRRSVFEYFDSMSENLAQAADLKIDVILSNLGMAPWACVLAKALEVPSMGIYPFPTVPTDAFALPNTHRNLVRRLGNRAIGQQLLIEWRANFDEALVRFCRRLELPERVAHDAWDQCQGLRGWPVNHGYSRAVLPHPTDWPANVETVGYWWPPVSPTWRPSEEVVSFLSDGPPPVFIGFGSLAVDGGRGLALTVGAAVRQAGVRAVVQAGWSNLKLRDDHVLSVGDIPHHWLFPQTAAVVHHAGAGTTAAGLRAGRPTVAVPFVVDQTFWASRIFQLGAGPAPLPYHDLTADGLADAIRAAVEQPRYAACAAAASEQIAEEDGAGRVVTRIEEFAS